MNWMQRFAIWFYLRLPLPKIAKNVLKKGVFTLIPSWIPPDPIIPIAPPFQPVTAEAVNKAEESLSLDHKSKMISRISPATQEGLEIGPLCFPVVSKMESGGHIWYVDYATGAELRKKYKDEPIVNLDEIVETIFRWGERSLQELVDNKQFDYVIASHVIEHVPDMLGWLKEIAAVLKDKGILSLAIPDKRYTFDYLHELSTPGMMIEAYLSHPRQPGPREVFDHYAFMIQVDPIAVWEGNQDNIILKRVSPIQEAFELAQDSLIAGHYHDAHVSVFPLASFLDLLEIAIRLNLFDFILVDFYSTVRNTLEFFVSLERLPRDENHDESLARKLASISWARERAS